jgi:hypothetical protein
MVSVNKEAVKRKARRAGKRAKGYVSERVASTRRVAGEKVGRVRERAARAVAERVVATGGAVRRRTTAAHRAAATRILDAAIAMSRKQQDVLERIKVRL